MNEWRAARNYEQQGLKAGDVATLVDYVPRPGGGPGLCLEVFNAVGESIAVVTVEVSDIGPLQAEVLAVRPLTQAG